MEFSDRYIVQADSEGYKVSSVGLRWQVLESTIYVDQFPFYYFIEEKNLYDGFNMSYVVFFAKRYFRYVHTLTREREIAENKYPSSHHR